MTEENFKGKRGRGVLRGRAYGIRLSPDNPNPGNPAEDIKPAWEISIAFVDANGEPIVNKKGENQLELAKELKLYIREPNDYIQQEHVTIKQPTERKDKVTGEMKPNRPPSVFHSDKTEWDFEKDGLIGNGSLVDVSFDNNMYRNTATKEWVNAAYIRGVMIRELVEYGRSVTDDFEVEEEFLPSNPKTEVASIKEVSKADVPFDTDEDMPDEFND